MNRIHVRLGILALAILVLSFVGAPAGRAEVRLTEIKIEAAQQKIELFNSGPSPVNLGGWRFTSLTATLDLAGTINAGQFLVFNLPPGPSSDFAHKRGDVLELFDPNLRAIVDRVDFGDTGGAPPDQQSAPSSSLARAQGTADPSGARSAADWTVDFSSSFGSANSVSVPQLSGPVVVNEVIPQGPNVAVELYNRSGAPVSLAGYKLTNGQDSVAVSGIIPPNGSLVFPITPLNFEFSLNVYLFRSDQVRIDQIGLSDSRGNQATWIEVKTANLALGRCPDGQGPSTGFNLVSSGYPTLLQRMTPTPAAPNRCSGVPLLSPPGALVAFLLLALAAGWRLVRRGPGARGAGSAGSQGLAGPPAAS